jgi:hypothetical protein
MKKVKIMLMSALVVAAVGGALAFKAQKFSAQLNCGITTNSCSTVLDATFAGATSQDFDSYCTDNGTTNCTYAKKEI